MRLKHMRAMCKQQYFAKSDWVVWLKHMTAMSKQRPFVETNIIIGL